MKIIVSGGGTGGHVYPAISIIEALRKVHPDLEVLYVGTRRGIEADIVPKEGLDFDTIEIEGLKRKLTMKNLTTLKLLFRAVREVRRLIKTFKPDAVIGTGGYVSGPVLLAAKSKGIDYFIHEQNAHPGLVNRFMARWAKKVYISFDESRDFFGRKDNLVYTGNPIRKAFQLQKRDDCRSAYNLEEKELLVLSVGGSGGAETINKMMAHALHHFRDREDIRFIHSTGRHHEENFHEYCAANGLSHGANAVIKDFLYDMPRAIQAADLVISRAGASTLTEIVLSHVPSILIPSPNVAEDHQRYNASVIENHGAGVMLEEKNLNRTLFIETIEALLDDSDRRAHMAEACDGIANPRAVDEIVRSLTLEVEDA